MLSNCFPQCERDLNVDPLNNVGNHVGMIRDYWVWFAKLSKQWYHFGSLVSYAFLNLRRVLKKKITFLPPI